MRFCGILITMFAACSLTHGSLNETDSSSDILRSRNKPSYNRCSGNSCESTKASMNILREDSTLYIPEKQLSGNSQAIVSLKEIDNVASKVAKMAWQIVETSIQDCQNVVVTENGDKSVIQHILRYSYLSSKPLVVVDLKKYKKDGNSDLEKKLWGRSSCRTLLIDFTEENNRQVFSILESSRLWLWNAVRVLVIGSTRDIHSSLFQRSFRNILRPMYLAIGDQTLQQLRTSPLGTVDGKVSDENVELHGRCLYCSDGNPKVQFLGRWPLGAEVPKDIEPFPGQEKNMQRHLVRVTSMELFPYVVYVSGPDEETRTLNFGECFDGRMIETFSSKLNFSYEVRNPEDDQWGVVLPGGNWTGLYGDIQYEKADFTTITSPSSGRLEIVDFARFYVAEAMDIVSLKPQVLPRYLIIIRPFTTDVWLYLLLGIMGWAGVFWLFQSFWARLTNSRARNVSECIFYSWAVILEDPPPSLPKNTSGQILVGYWLLGCLIITTGYKAGLMANLTVESKAPPIETLGDMVDRQGWEWGLLRSFFSSNEMTYLKTSPDPTVQTVGKYIQGVADINEGLERVAEGGFSFIHMQNEVLTEVESYHTDSSGMTQYYISKEGPKMTADYGFGLRKGLPYGEQMKYLMNRMIESGITDYLMQKIIRFQIARNRQAIGQKEKKMERDDVVVLRMSHMFGVFLCLLLGYSVSSSALLFELVVNRFHYKVEARKSIDP